MDLNGLLRLLSIPLVLCGFGYVIRRMLEPSVKFSRPLVFASDRKQVFEESRA